MGNALWLFRSLPLWYVSSLEHLDGSVLTLIPLLGVIALVIGLPLAVVGRRAMLLRFMLLPLGSQILVAFAGFYRGKLRGPGASWILAAFLLFELCVTLYLIYRSKGARIAAALLSFSSLSYALFAAFVAGMSLSDSWI